MEVEETVTFFEGCMEKDPGMSVAVAAIHTLIEFIRKSPAETLSELREVLQKVIQVLTKADIAVASVSSGCELFLRFITLAALDNPDFKECKRVLIERGQLFLKRAADARAKIAKLSDSFIKDGATILTHSRSRVVIEILKSAAKQKKRFNVFITESAPDKSGHLMHDQLEECGIPSTVILDTAVGYIIEKVNLVLVGAEGVVESGGIINKIGTYQMAVMTKAANKPFYVVAESFKFVRLYPLNQEDVPNIYKYTTSRAVTGHPLVDYTPPTYITLLFTDLGVLTPSAVSDELIKLYL
ncbi:translation initiation factor eIF-2B subunit alpha [Exaiptasia diaphana]|uniref:Translation initiation factor eIF2B subunit alpha n=1 Tax=Exaiptasia diaphana TaxID=2652724 RepID=A0A913Y6C4_EXADI|nr:translation initiation factor eIF-2B subunit alpha [Exaiptasia diaphana]KXJ29025.1 Translation initiation factor eIF-2B subunit alpha [Exaiptasia diaphana]